MARPVIAIVGRPNVGKSTIFNRIIGDRLAIVEDKPGITRDRLYGTGEWNGQTFSVIDTGGIETGEEDSMLKLVRVQAELAIEEADAIALSKCGNCDAVILVDLLGSQRRLCGCCQRPNPASIAHRDPPALRRCSVQQHLRPRDAPHPRCHED